MAPQEKNNDKRTVNNKNGEAPKAGNIEIRRVLHGLAQILGPIQKWDRSHNLFQAQNREFKPRGCAYYGDVGHKATECEKITNVVERKQVLAKKGLCFNCATTVHRASGMQE